MADTEALDPYRPYAAELESAVPDDSQFRAATQKTLDFLVGRAHDLIPPHWEKTPDNLELAMQISLSGLSQTLPDRLRHRFVNTAVNSLAVAEPNKDNSAASGQQAEDKELLLGAIRHSFAAELTAFRLLDADSKTPEKESFEALIAEYERDELDIERCVDVEQLQECLDAIKGRVARKFWQLERMKREQLRHQARDAERQLAGDPALYDWLQSSRTMTRLGKAEIAINNLKQLLDANGRDQYLALARQALDLDIYKAARQLLSLSNDLNEAIKKASKLIADNASTLHSAGDMMQGLNSHIYTKLRYMPPTDRNKCIDKYVAGESYKEEMHMANDADLFARAVEWVAEGRYRDAKILLNLATPAARAKMIELLNL